MSGNGEILPTRPAGNGSGSGTGSGSGEGSGEILPTRLGSANGSDVEPDVGKAIAELGAVPAWQTVVDRSQYLARRGQHGVAYGVIGSQLLMLGPTPEPVIDGGIPIDAGMIPSPYLWLIDDSEGNGALAIRIKLAPHLPAVKQGDRVALGGAWALDDNRGWYWKADAVSPLPAVAGTDLKDPPAAPGHTVIDGGLPPGARRVSLAKDNDVVYFTVVGAPPVIDGDGWPVADELGNPVYALLNLPGERPSYGAQDLRAVDERWQLKRGSIYALRIGRVRKHGLDKPVTINARTAPARVK